MNKKLHIVSFDVPYPPVYGGVIDVFYKLKALSELGIEIYLHTFEYGTGRQSELEKYCKNVYYYQRSSSLKRIFSKLPFIVNSRKNEILIQNLKKIKAAILFEGLHTTYPLLKHNFKDRKILIRTHNIEHEYYFGLAKSDKLISKKIFFNIEALKLKYYQSILKKADSILSISPLEFKYFNKLFENKTVYIPVFHRNTQVKSLSKKGSFALYHGDLRVSDNLKAAFFLIDIFNDLNYNLIIAGNTLNKNLLRVINKTTNISFEKLENNTKLISLFKEAHINILPTFQKTGIKLKLINTLYNGRFCLVNNEMIAGTGLENLCLQANSKNEFRNQILDIANKEYLFKNTEKKERLLKAFNNTINANKIIDLL
ncbi:MAG: hypothetical protein ABFR32_03885 [Bacteroidota bacterium]